MAQENIAGRPHVGPDPVEFEIENGDCVTCAMVRDETTWGVLWRSANGLVYWVCWECMDAMAEGWDNDRYGHNPSEDTTLTKELAEGTEASSRPPETSNK